MIRKPQIVAVASLLMIALMTFISIAHSNSPLYVASHRQAQTFVDRSAGESKGDVINTFSTTAAGSEPPKPVQPELPARTSHDFGDRKTIKHFFSEASLHDVPPSSNKRTILFNVVIGGPESYGNGRTISDLLKTLGSLWASHHNYYINIGLLVYPELELTAVDEYLTANPVPGVDKVTVIYAPFLESNLDTIGSDRHKDSVQRIRRRTIARVRNYLMHSTLEDLDYVFFMDADVSSFDKPEIILPLLIHSDKPIIVPRVTLGDLKDYDRNSWKGERTKPSKEQLDLMDQGKWEEAAYVPRDANVKHVADFADLTSETPDPNHIEKIDSVGGAVLFIKSTVLRQGVVFPTSYIIGTTWDRLEGYDGIETEGVCYLAKPLGFDCYVMPNLVANHLNRNGS